MLVWFTGCGLDHCVQSNVGHSGTLGRRDYRHLVELEMNVAAYFVSLCMLPVCLAYPVNHVMADAVCDD